MYKNILKLVIVFVFGISGGIFASQILWPSLVERPLIDKYQLAGLPISINETKEIIIEENTALQDVVEDIEKSIIGVKSKTKAGKTITGSGVVVTSDGLIVTLSELVPSQGSFVFFVDGKTPNWQILKRDRESNLVLIKLEQSDLVTVGFADRDKIRLGQRVFLLGTIFDKKPLRFVNEGIIKFFIEEYIKTSIEEDASLGSALFNIKGELLGLNTADNTIPINKIREFIGY